MTPISIVSCNILQDTLTYIYYARDMRHVPQAFCLRSPSRNSCMHAASQVLAALGSLLLVGGASARQAARYGSYDATVVRLSASVCLAGCRLAG